MNTMYLTYPFLITAGVLFSFLLFVLSLKYQRHQLSRAIQGIALVAFSINISTILSMYAPNPTQATWWHGPVRLAAYAFIGPIGLSFTYSFVQQRHFYYWNRFPWHFLFLGSILTAVVSLTNNWHHWFFRSYTMEQYNGYIIRANWEPGPWFWVYTIFSYLVGCGTIWVLVTWVRQTHKLPRWRGLLLLSVVLLFIGTITLDAERMRNLQTETRQRDDNLRQELLSLTANLDGKKTSRHDLGQMLMELGLRLRQDSDSSS